MLAFLFLHYLSDNHEAAAKKELGKANPDLSGRSCAKKECPPRSIFDMREIWMTRGIQERLTKVEQYRESILRRTVDIADYLNWFEATQMSAKSDAFEGHLKIANELETPIKRNDPISHYLDEAEENLTGIGDF